MTTADSNMLTLLAAFTVCGLPREFWAPSGLSKSILAGEQAEKQTEREYGKGKERWSWTEGPE